MKLVFADKSLETLCNSRAMLRARLGEKLSKVAERTLHRLNHIPSLADVSELPPMSRYLISNQPELVYAIGPRDKLTMLIRPHASNENAKLSEVDSIFILHLEAVA